jgi:hypothetical protein
MLREATPPKERINGVFFRSAGKTARGVGNAEDQMSREEEHWRRGYLEMGLESFLGGTDLEK